MSPHDDFTSVAAAADTILHLAADIIAERRVPMPDDGSANPVGGRFDMVRRQLSNSAEPVVSVIIPTCNRPELLPNAVASVVCQSGVTLELIVVNDCSAPIAGSVVNRLFNHDVPLTFVQHHANLGLGAARNTGAALARGTWMMMLDDDDVLLPHGIERLLAAVAADSEAGFVFGDHQRQWYDGAAPATLEYRRSAAALDELHIENAIICGSFLVRRRLFSTVGGYREDLPVHEDYNLHVRVLSLSRPVHVAAPICVYHCRTMLPRLNHHRLHWFATSAFNHAVFRSLFDRTRDRDVTLAQTENQYEHLARSLNEGCPLSIARARVAIWWNALRSRGLHDYIAMDRQVLPVVCPALCR